jgi:hypothetical protein
MYDDTALKMILSINPSMSELSVDDPIIQANNIGITLSLKTAVQKLVSFKIIVS